MREQRVAPVHPGKVLLEDFLKPMGVSQYRLARSIGVPVQRIHDLVHGRRAMTADPHCASPASSPWRRSSG
jgi:addiction module HigA family antidote